MDIDDRMPDSYYIACRKGFVHKPSHRLHDNADEHNSRYKALGKVRKALSNFAGNGCEHTFDDILRCMSSHIRDPTNMAWSIGERNKGASRSYVGHGSCDQCAFSRGRLHSSSGIDGTVLYSPAHSKL